MFGRFPIPLRFARPSCKEEQSWATCFAIWFLIAVGADRRVCPLIACAVVCGVFSFGHSVLCPYIVAIVRGNSSAQVISEKTGTVKNITQIPVESRPLCKDV